MSQDDELCPCGSGKLYEECCKKEYDRTNAAREKIKQAMSDPKKASELKELLKNLKKED
ncbi:SEC-C metal-binding domain-containing protein [Bermanella sp. WJH001]|uniref:SEC-C metal-binding domain-containing protein n=1 Tax=Bermanella sp. WJH001 TaxID=3048005 RepID=UPI0024BE6CB8|nr:SEC-C metal-binding domain-containing protein [Bermanella sp. WJH001]MDJ1536668.1 SEC-C metal-binding domain-containing protein [Bermanella sp. WJH001]